MTHEEIKNQLTKIVDSLVIENNPLVLDDNLPDVVANQDLRNQATDQLITLIKVLRGWL